MSDVLKEILVSRCATAQKIAKETEQELELLRAESRKHTKSKGKFLEAMTSVHETDLCLQEALLEVCFLQEILQNAQVESARARLFATRQEYDAYLMASI